MSTKNVQVRTQDEYTEAFSTYMAGEVFKLLDEAGQGELTEDLIFAFLERFTGAVILTALVDRPDTIVSEEELYEYSRKRFLGTKQGIQDAIAGAFQNATKQYSGLQTGYYCKVMTMPEPTNKEPC